MKRLLLLSILFASLASAQTDTSLFNWFQQGHLYNGGLTFQRWPGHWWDTLATLRDLRAGGGGGGGTIGDTITIKVVRTNNADVKNRLLFTYLVPAHTDTILAYSGSSEMCAKFPLMNSWEGLITAPNYTIPATRTADTFAIAAFVNGSRLLKANDFSDFAIEFQLYIKNLYYNDSTWQTIGEWYGHNMTHYIPYYLNYDTTVATLSAPGGWGRILLNSHPYTFWRNGWPGYSPTWWVFGIMPGATVKYRYRTYYNGQTTFGDAYPRIYPTLVGGTLPVSWMVYSTVPIYTPDTWIPSAQMDSTAWILWGNSIAWKDFEVYQNLKAQTGSFRNGLRVGEIPDTLSSVFHATPQDTVVGVLRMITDSAGEVTLRPSGHRSGAFLLPEVEHDGVADTLLSQKDILCALPFLSTIKYVQADTNIAFIVSGDTLKIRSTTEAGPGGASFYTNPAEKPPTSPSAFNDEFDTYNGSVPDTNSRWKFLGTKAQNLLQLSYGITNSRYWFADTSKGGATNLAHLLGQEITDTAFTISTKVNLDFDGGLAGFAGLFVYDSTSTRGLMIRIHSSDATFNGQYQTVAQFTGQTAIGTEVITSISQRALPLLTYFKIEKTTSKALNFYRSEDGISWQLWYSTTSTGYVESAGRINWVGIVTGNYQGSAFTTVGTFNWFRYNWTADFDPTLHK